ncbi:Lipid A biosynthesis lauroyl acyltransferase [Candidatus Rhodobacter oscarellae]|uniref:Lipid A biosynthesis lauroyl acyltransferase n=1 Tax=Candidatus Rhodobacter oscarellae TaxID=1675527 RepID=A0A0J9E2C7_9RHOB|nr:lauroyl acyltransferase [Candidatus Rhodobacter lobularis]KMW57016.1 Lipid A biosynthesis lauroyl acyltransferase [Candidatus Rhodobacter lobularis]
MVTKRRGAPEYLQNLAISAVIGLALALPYRARVRFVGRVMSAVVAPLAGWRRRIRDNLALVMPELPASEVDRLTRQVPNNFGRSLIESYSRQAFIARAAAVPFQGAGVQALEAARDENRPVILVTGHFGNHQAPRAALIAKGYRVGGLYMPMSNGYFNDRYVAELGQIGEPLFERSRKGLAEMVKFLRGGGMVGMVADHHMAHGAPIDFMGRPAYTALSAAEMALKYNALAIPIYGRRAADGFGFEIIVDAPIPPGDPLEMTRAMNESLERLVEENPEQWFWIHRRWKTPPQAAV